MMFGRYRIVDGIDLFSGYIVESQVVGINLIENKLNSPVPPILRERILTMHFFSYSSYCTLSVLSIIVKWFCLIHLVLVSIYIY